MMSTTGVSSKARTVTAFTATRAQFWDAKSRLL